MVPRDPRRIAAGLGIGAAAVGTGLVAGGISEMTTGRSLTSNVVDAMGADYDVGGILPKVTDVVDANIQYDHQAIAAQEMMSATVAPTGMVGTGPQMAGPMHNAMQRSTQGLVQGLHRGRHS
jgi:hypothetical protein